MSVKLPRDPWVKTKTYHDLPAAEVISALQKEIRRGNTENTQPKDHQQSKPFHHHLLFVRRWRGQARRNARGKPRRYP